ncbi:MAG TPA: ADP-ribosylglycohydrolase family protein [bacterium]|nr:ADP-ribosylglycohydrolase family protein [bacterium]HPN43084.1 ADP-ribosylglycohydrolase family protein [bacterium]
MKTKIVLVIFISLLMSLLACSKSDIKTISVTELQDKIAGGWAGKMFGVSYGAPTEFRAMGEMYTDSLTWEPNRVTNSLQQDDLYVQMSFMMTMDKYGINAPADKLAESFANAGYMLWCANVQARKNFFDGIMPPLSGSPKYSLWADAIDFQIEADYIGFMCPGMPQTSNAICDNVGHIMNYGDGVYGGMFVCALYTQAYFEKDINKIVSNALLAIPAESDYAKCIQDVITLYQKYPDSWQSAWGEFEEKWGDTDLSGPLNPFNIDAKVNGAYIVMGLLYGNGDYEKTMDISIRCGQDSDCNPSNAAAVLGIRDGYSNIPGKWKGGIDAIADSIFIFTEYSFNKVVQNTLKYAEQLVTENGGKIENDVLYVKTQLPLAPAKLEVSFPGIKPVSLANINDPNWTWSGKWQTIAPPAEYVVLEQPGSKVTNAKGAEAKFTFTGTGILIVGKWDQDCGIADVLVDGQLARTIDNYYWVSNYGGDNAFLYHNLELAPGEHTIAIVNKGEKNAKATDTRLKIQAAVVYDKK